MKSETKEKGPDAIAIMPLKRRGEMAGKPKGGPAEAMAGDMGREAFDDFAAAAGFDPSDDAFAAFKAAVYACQED